MSEVAWIITEPFHRKYPPVLKREGKSTWLLLISGKNTLRGKNGFFPHIKASLWNKQSQRINKTVQAKPDVNQTTMFTPPPLHVQYTGQ